MSFDLNEQFDMALEIAIGIRDEIVEEMEQEEANNVVPETRRYIDRQRQLAEERLFSDYFIDNSTYQAYHFRRRFRMHKPLFMKIVNDLAASSAYFRQRPNATGELGFHPIQKCTAVMRMLAYGTQPDALDESIRMSERTARESLIQFCDQITILYGDRYMREPTPNDIRQLYAHHGHKHGFPGMLASLDCMHWKWAACPTAWAACPTPNSSFVLRGTQYRFGYYLVDEIYPEHSVLVKTLTCPDDPQRLKFKRCQEHARKDIERAFGVLKKRFQIVSKPSRFRRVSVMKKVMHTCMILHNMILENEGRAICQYDENEIIPSREQYEYVSPEYVDNYRRVRDSTIHGDLRRHLIDHLWTQNHLDLNMPPPVVDDDEFSDEDHL